MLATQKSVKFPTWGPPQRWAPARRESSERLGRRRSATPPRKKARRRLEYEEATYTDLARINQRVAAILAEDAPLGPTPDREGDRQGC
jgi:hypothetical protein